MTTYYAAFINEDALLLTGCKTSVTKQGHKVNVLPKSATKTTNLKAAHKVGGGGRTVVIEEIQYYVINRGRNTGAGDAYVYWLSPGEVDTAGTYYPVGKPPWAQITDVMGAGYKKVPVV